MKTRIRIVFILLIAFINLPTQAAIPNTAVYVWAVKGLLMYQKPVSNSKVITTLPYGTPLTVLKETVSAATLIQPLPGMGFKKPHNIKGHWVKVIVNGKSGYVFDGFISNMLPLKILAHGFEEADTYFKRTYGVLKVKKSKYKNDAKETTTYYKNGNILHQAAFDSCFDDKLIFKNITYTDALLFEQAYLNGADAVEDVRVVQQKDGSITLSYYSCT